MTLTSSTPTRAGSFSCAASGGGDPDGDTTTATYVWKVAGVVLTGQTSPGLSGSHMGVVKGATVTCEVALSDGMASSVAVASNGIVVQNDAPTLACTWAGGPLGTIRTLGAGTPIATQMACSSTDSDAADTLTWSTSGCTGAFSVNPTSGALTGTMPQGRCTLVVAVSDGAANATTSLGLDYTSTAMPVFGGNVFAMAAHPDGDVLAGGDFTKAGGEPAKNLMVLHPNGDRDFRYSTFNGEIKDVHAYPDGRLLVVGEFTQYGAVPAPRIARLEPDGSLDATFAANVSGAPECLRSIAVHTASGRIYVAGCFDSWKGTTIAGIVALASDGTRVATFKPGNGLIASNGTATAWTGVSDVFFDPSNVDIDQANEHIYAGGGFTDYYGTPTIPARRLIRFDANGYVDQRFTKGTGPDAEPDGLAFNNVTGAVIIAGNINDYAGTNVDGKELLFLSTTNTLDTTAQANIGDLGGVRGVRVLDDGDVLAMGAFEGQAGSSAHNGVVRLNPDGTRDASSPLTTGSNPHVIDGFVDSSGRYVMLGAFTQWNGTTGLGNLVRLTSAGAVDPTFDVGTGVPNEGFWVGRSTWLGAGMPDGRMVIAGKFQGYRSGSTARRLAKFNPLTGALDLAFMANAYAEENVAAIHVDTAASRIYFGGRFNSFAGNGALNGIARVDLTGVVDSAFTGPNDDGFEVFGIMPAPSHPTDGNVSGDLYVAGELRTNGSDGKFTVRRLNANGSLDTNFDAGTGWDGGQLDWNWGGLMEPGPGAVMAYHAASGRLYVTGRFTQFNGTPRSRHLALTSTGALVGDGSYANGTFDFSPRTMFVEPASGNPVFLGMFDNYAGSGAPGVVRLNNDGTRNSTFDSGSDFFFDTRTFLLEGNTLYVAGPFGRYKGSLVPGNLIALDMTTAAVVPSGTFDPGAGFSGSTIQFLLKVTKSGADYLYAYGDVSAYDGEAIDGHALLRMDGDFVK